VTRRAHHLNDEQLFESYLSERGGEPIDPPSAVHLADCRECSAKYGELVRLMDAIRREAEAETAEAFTADRLYAQKQQILRRVEHVGRPARVLDFPGHLVARHMNPSGYRVTRWVYAAAAAGLVVGVGLGAVYQSEWVSLQTGSRTAAVRQIGGARSHVTSAATAAGAGSEGAEDAFLSELDLALAQPHTPTLQPFDALTPHVRDISDRIR
jgi:anti-sigma factor RsiW